MTRFAGRLRALRVLLVVGAAVGLGLLLWRHGLDWSRVGQTLRNADWRWAGVAVGLNFLSAIARALSWRTVVVNAVPPPHPRYRDLFSAFFVGIFANGILPGRAGEVTRVAVLVRRMPPRKGLWPALLGSVLAHRLLEIFPSFGLIVWVLVAAKLPHWALQALLVVLALGAAGLVAGVLLARRHEHVALVELGRIRTILGRAREGLGVLRRPVAAASGAAFQAAGWGLQLAAVWAAMRAFHISLPLVAAGLVLALMNIALIVPLWPGNVGLQQAAVALPLVSYGVAYARGFAYGIGLQAIESSVGYVFGVACVVREGFSPRALRRSLAALAESYSPATSRRRNTR